MYKHAFYATAALACAALSAPMASAAVITGPTSMAFTTQNWGGSGMVITALRDISLTSVDFWSQGKADTLQLQDLGGAVLQSQAVVANPAVATIALNWNLTAGTSYRLMQTTRDNSQWNITPPAANADLAVTTPGVFFNRANQGGGYEVFPSIWVAFTNITTSNAAAAVPEPATWAMMVAGFGLVGGALRGRRRTKVSFA